MNDFDKNESFFDSRTVIAIVLVMAAIFGWQIYLAKKYPLMNSQSQAPVSEKAESQSLPTNQGQATVQKKQATTATQEISAQLGTTNEEIIEIKTPNISFELSNKGMGIRNVLLNNYIERDGQIVSLGKGLEQNYINETQVSGQPVFFSVKKINDTAYEGIATVNGTKIIKTLTLDPSQFLFEVTHRIENPKEPLSIAMSENIKERKSSFLIPAFDYESLFVQFSGDTKSVHLDPTKSTVIEEKLSNVTMASLGAHYFTTLIKDKSSIVPEIEAQTNTQSKITTAKLNYVFSNVTTADINYKMFIGPKDNDILTKIDEDFSKVINYGYFSFIAKPILSMLKFFYSFIGNYGVAIIIVTLIIRALLLPLNVSSYKSMKKMQEIQPQLKSLREKHKENPQQLQIETMNLMKVNKVNPLGGCLPMLLQLPIFIALYNVLAMSIELYQAPFIFWIKDLSLKDPFYVLPILMGITMYIQQKITPTTLDPAQAKVMQIMPVIFSLLMITLPSGLTLYIFISTLFGIIQQYYFMNDKKLNANK